ncbi:MAG: hypothetical protein WAZ44_02940 [Minisyncoccia bacterium]
MEYATKLARRVLARRPGNPIESARILNEVLADEGYIDPDSEVLANLRRDIANAAREILRKQLQEKAS